MTRTIYSYSGYRGRTWNTYGEEKDFAIDKIIYTGLELETEPRNYIDYDQKQNVAEFIYNTLDEKNVCAEDSSLSDGIEIITEPMTPSEMINNFAPKNIKKLMEGLTSDYNFKSHDGGRCGLHIHFTRPYEKGSEEDINFYNRLCFIFETFKDNIKIISRRKSFNYCGFFSDNRTADLNTFKSIYGLKKNFDYIQGDHGYMLNNNNTNTIEIRILRGTLNYDTFIASYKIMVNLFNLAFKDIKELEKISFKKAINASDPDIKKYIASKCLDYNVRLIDYSKQLIKLETLKNDILLKSFKYLNKINNIYLKDITKYRIDTTDKETTKKSRNELASIFNALDEINNTLNNLTRYIDEKSTYYSFDELKNQLRNITNLTIFNNPKIKDYVKKLLNEINKEF